MHGRRLGPREASRRVGRVLDAPTVCPAWSLEPVCLGGWQGAGPLESPSQLLVLTYDPNHGSWGLQMVEMGFWALALPFFP